MTDEELYSAFLALASVAPAMGVAFSVKAFCDLAAFRAPAPVASQPPARPVSDAKRAAQSENAKRGWQARRSQAMPSASHAGMPPMPNGSHAGMPPMPPMPPWHANDGRGMPAGVARSPDTSRSLGGSGQEKAESEQQLQRAKVDAKGDDGGMPSDAKPVTGSSLGDAILHELQRHPVLADCAHAAAADALAGVAYQAGKPADVCVMAIQEAVTKGAVRSLSGEAIADLLPKFIQNARRVGPPGAKKTPTGTIEDEAWFASVSASMPK